MLERGLKLDLLLLLARGVLCELEIPDGYIILQDWISRDSEELDSYAALEIEQVEGYLILKL